MWFHLPYPYAITRDVIDDLTDFEYNFQFVWKAAWDYGIDLWNGVYYLFDAGGVGRMQSINLDREGPPEDGEMRPISHADLHKAVAVDHLFRSLN